MHTFRRHNQLAGHTGVRDYCSMHLMWWRLIMRRRDRSREPVARRRVSGRGGGGGGGSSIITRRRNERSVSRGRSESPKSNTTIATPMSAIGSRMKRRNSQFATALSLSLVVIVSPSRAQGNQVISAALHSRSRFTTAGTTGSNIRFYIYLFNLLGWHSASAVHEFVSSELPATLVLSDTTWQLSVMPPDYMPHLPSDL